MPINCKILKKIFKKSKYNCNAMKMAILSCATTDRVCAGGRIMGPADRT